MGPADAAGGGAAETGALNRGVGTVADAVRGATSGAGVAAFGGSNAARGASGLGSNDQPWSGQEGEGGLDSDELRPIEPEAEGNGGAGQGSNVGEGVRRGILEVQQRVREPIREDGEGVVAAGFNGGRGSNSGLKGGMEVLLHSFSDHTRNFNNRAYHDADSGGDEVGNTGSAPPSDSNVEAGSPWSPRITLESAAHELSGSSSTSRRRGIISIEGSVLRVAVLPVTAFPPGRLSILLPGWLSKHKLRVVVVCDDVHRTVEEREEGLIAAGLWVVKAGEGGKGFVQDKQALQESMTETGLRA